VKKRVIKEQFATQQENKISKVDQVDSKNKIKKMTTKTKQKN